MPSHLVLLRKAKVALVLVVSLGTMRVSILMDFSTFCHEQLISLILCDFQYFTPSTAKPSFLTPLFFAHGFTMLRIAIIVFDVALAEVLVLGCLPPRPLSPRAGYIMPLHLIRAAMHDVVRRRATT